jgi:3-hydroxybutyryl-CoA dehydrogenase
MKNVRKVAVIGAGMMGAEIALSFARQGIPVILKDIALDMALAGKRRVEGILSKWSEKGKIEPSLKEEIALRITPQEDYSGFDQVDLVIEAAIEERSVKNIIFAELDKACGPECLFASNTSSIPITQLAAATQRPDRFVGMHFFSPASVMKLVEVIAGLESSEETIATVLEIVREIGKEPVRVKDCAGFLVNRLLFAFFNEAWRAVDEGVATPEDVDKAVKLGLGHPVGIFQMQDLVGLDNALSVSTTLFEEYGERYKPSPLLKKKVAAGHFGRKTKKGWFTYN